MAEKNTEQELPKKAVCFYVSYNSSEWPKETKDRIIEVIEKEKECEAEIFTVSRRTRKETLFQKAIYFFQMDGTPQTQPDEFCDLENIIAQGSRVLVILSDKDILRRYSLLYAGEKNSRVQPYPDAEHLIKDLWSRLKDY